MQKCLLHLCDVKQGIQQKSAYLILKNFIKSGTHPLDMIKMNGSNSSESKKKRFSCSFCEYSTKYKWHLASHERRHKGEKPFSCEICSKSFVEKSVLNEHRHTHLGAGRRGLHFSQITHKLDKRGN